MSGSRATILCALFATSLTHGSVVDAPALMRVGTATASARPLPFFYDLYTFRGDADGTAIVTAFAVEAGELETEEAGGSVQYRFSVSFVLADTALRSITGTHDTAFVAVDRPMSDEHLLYTHVEVVAPPSSSTRQRVIMNDATRPGIGQLYSEYFPIPDYSGTSLMLSDIALGQPDAGAGWTRGDVTLALLPTSQFPSSAFDVYYEIYNLPAGTRYSTAITIDDLGEGAEPASEAAGRAKGQPVSLGFTGVAAGGSDDAVHELRRVETSLEKGTYRLTVTITDLKTGVTATRSRDFQVRGWERDMTMVPATRVSGTSR